MFNWRICRSGVGIPIVSLGVAIGALVGLGAVSVPVSPLGEDWIL